MAKIFETEEDLKNEREVALEFAGLVKGCTIHKMDKYSLDYMIQKDNVGRAFIEVKCASSKFDEMPTQIISSSKVKAMSSFAKILPTFLVFRFSCGTIGYIEYNDIKGNERVSGRKPRKGSVHDIEKCIHIPRNILKTIKKTQ